MDCRVWCLRVHIGIPGVYYGAASGRILLGQMATPASGDGDGGDGGGVATVAAEGASGGNVEEGGMEVVIRWMEDVSPADIPYRLLLRFR